MGGTDSLGRAPVAAGITSARSVEHVLSTLFDSAAPQPICAVVVGAVGNGVRTLIRDRMPQIIDGTVTLAGHWPDADATAAHLLCPDAASVPQEARPPRWSDVGIVIGCHAVEDLPDWVHALPPNQCEWLTLDELTREELGSLLIARLGGTVAGSTLSVLGSSSGLVPGFLTVLLRVLTREGILAQIDDVWTLTAPVPAELFTPHVNSALAEFDAGTRELFLRMCLIGTGQQNGFTAVERRQLGQLERAGLVRRGRDHGYAVPSSTLAEAGQLLMDPATAAEHFVTALESPSPPDSAVLWALRSGTPVRAAAAEAVIRAALTRHDWSQANLVAGLTLARFADHDDALFRCEVLIHQAVALRFMDEPEEALACLAHAESLLTAAARADDLRVRIAMHRADILHFKFGRLDTALTDLSLARQAVNSDELRTKLDGEHVLHLIYGGRFRAATDAHRLLEKKLHRGHSRSRTQIAIARCLQLVAEGEIQRGFSQSFRLWARQLLPPVREAWLVEELSAAYFVSAFRLHPPSKLRTLMRRFEGQSAASFNPDDTTYRLARAFWLLAAGKVAEAAREASACHANTQFHDPSGLEQAVVALRAQTAALVGDQQVSRSMLSAIRTLPPRTSAIIAGGCAANLSTAEFLLGRPDAIDRTIERADAFIAEGAFGFAAETLHSGIRFGSSRIARRLIDIRDRVSGPLVSLHADHAAAVCAEDAVALAEIGDRYQRIGLPLYAVEAYGLALRQSVIPEIVERRAEHEQRRLLSVIGDVAHPLIPRSTENDVTKLTRREQEVQELITRGLSNREIAQRLSLSPRTVEGHIARLYQKTGRARRDPKRRA